MISVIVLAFGWLFLFYTEVGMTNVIGEGARETRLSEYDYAAIPQAVIDDAAELAREMARTAPDTAAI